LGEGEFTRHMQKLAEASREARAGKALEEMISKVGDEK